MKIKLSKENLDFAIKHYKEFKSLRKTSSELNISRTTLTRIFKENNITINMSSKDLKPTFKEDFFSNITTEEQAYWIGFLAADGYLDKLTNSIRIELSSKDLDHLFALCESLDYPTNRIKQRSNRNTYWISISSIQLFNDIIKLNIKSDTIGASNILQELHSSLLRGFYDGDGSIYHKGKKSLGTGLIARKEQLEFISSIIPVNDIKIRPVAKTKPEGMWRLETYNLKASKELCKYLYNNSSIFLERKYNKYISRCTHEGASTTIISPS